jgi:molybdenum cofactor cytidylyltransferase
MNLVQALRLIRIEQPVFDEPPCLALVGAGGKTTALFRIANQLPGPVIVTATTHLAIHQARLADQHLIIRDTCALDFLETLPDGKVILVTGPQTKGERLAGIDPDYLDRLYSFTSDHRIPLLIEADGSRQRPVKAPDEHEPALPGFVRQVGVVAGLSALGKPVGEDWVHRPERFSGISGISPGAPITADGLGKALKSSEGGLKRIPPGARRIALLTQAIDPGLRAVAGRLARDLLPDYDAALILSLHAADRPPSRESTDQISRESIPPEEVIFAVHEPVAGILLAAGGSSRMGRPKQMLPWQGMPMVRFVASKALSAGLSPVIVVTGAFHDRVNQAVADLPVLVVQNANWEKGQSSSLRAGLLGLPREIGSALFLLVDQPQVPVELVHSMISLHAETLAPIVAPRVGERRANPVLFDRAIFPDLLTVEGDVGGRTLFSRHPALWLDWEDANILRDIDTEEDYRDLPKNLLL